jgi:hypothetical protein
MWSGVLPLRGSQVLIDERREHRRQETEIGHQPEDAEYKGNPHEPAVSTTR